MAVGDNDKCCCDDGTIDSEATESESTVQQNPKGRIRREGVSVSAGRKRAAADYEIDPELPCDWRGKVNCGGGFTPIPGCVVGFQTDRHHGPDKNTTNNAEENVHLICKPCHNLWHRRNDPLYANVKCPEGILSHDPRWATVVELPLLASKGEVA
jgi:hypothetical protein